MYKSSNLAEDGVVRKGKRSVHSFIAVPWADITKKYLGKIKTLSAKKWENIVSHAIELVKNKLD
jgi:hypothetical protein